MSADQDERDFAPPTPAPPPPWPRTWPPDRRDDEKDEEKEGEVEAPPVAEAPPVSPVTDFERLLARREAPPPPAPVITEQPSEAWSGPRPAVAPPSSVLQPQPTPPSPVPAPAPSTAEPGRPFLAPASATTPMPTETKQTPPSPVVEPKTEAPAPTAAVSFAPLAPSLPRPELPLRTTAPRPAPAAARAATSPATIRPAPRGRQPIDDLGHRARAAVALMGVSVFIGVMVAAMLTIALFLAGLALSRALGS